jgi:hypothetical protein
MSIMATEQYKKYTAYMKSKEWAKMMQLLKINKSMSSAGAGYRLKIMREMGTR